MVQNEISSFVLFITWWNRVYTEPDHFLGFVRIPLSSINLLEGDIFRKYPMITTGNYIIVVSLKKLIKNYFEANIAGENINAMLHKHKGGQTPSRDWLRDT